ncbi:MAG: TIGR00341 family protein [Candidatus Paceibacterota bacterium]
MSKDISPFFRKLFNLREGAEDKATIIENVKDDADFSSARFWTLVCAIVVASVGLNINSVPVVIGAMLISPLTGPIVSLGLALSINDWGLMRRSLRNLLTLITISIVISTLYFALSPIDNAQSELLARIKPTIFDVLIAIFGGVAGFIGISRARHSNIIPGVAIATAIMPPLCTVGYGIGTLQPQFIFGAFYLFLINCIFICLSALVVASYMKLPKRDYPEPEKKLRVKRIITLIILVIVSPAIYLAFTFVDQNNFYLNAENFLQTTFTNNGHVIIYQNLKYESNQNTIEVAFLSDHFSDSEIADFEARLPNFNLKKTKLIIRQNGYSLTEEDWQEALSNIRSTTEATKVFDAKLASELEKKRNPNQLLTELQALNPNIASVSIGTLETSESNPGDNKKTTNIIFVYTGEKSKVLGKDEAGRISDWLRVRLEDPSLIVHFNPLTQREMLGGSGEILKVRE